MKRSISLIVILTLLLSVCSTSLIFAQETNIINRYTIEGEEYIVRELANNKDYRITTVTCGTMVTKFTYDKRTEKAMVEDASIVTKSLYRSSSKSDNSFKEFEIDLSSTGDKEANKSVALASYTSGYNSEHYDYSFEITRYSSSKSIYTLEIPRDDITTHPVTSSSGVAEFSYDFKNEIRQADSATERVINLIWGFVPGIGHVNSVIGICNDITSQFENGFSKTRALSALIGAFELVGGSFGVAFSIGDVAGSALEVVRSLYDARGYFTDVVVDNNFYD